MRLQLNLHILIDELYFIILAPLVMNHNRPLLRRVQGNEPKIQIRRHLNRLLARLRA